MPKPTYCFLASSSFGGWVLKILAATCPPSLVITLPAQPAGRGLQLQPNIVYQIALKEKLPVIELHNWEQLADLDCRCALIAGFGKIIPAPIISHFSQGLLNLHPSLLPKYRGANPIRSVILDGQTETGTTLFLIDEQVDHGPIIGQEKLNLRGDETNDQLEQALGQLSGRLCCQKLEDFLAGKIKPIPQDHDQATITSKLNKQGGQLYAIDTYLTWDRKIRALQPWPGTYLKMEIKKEPKILKIFAIEPVPNGHLTAHERILPVGQFFEHGNELALRLSDAFITITELQLEGKKRMTSKEFLNGHQINQLTLA